MNSNYSLFNNAFLAILWYAFPTLGAGSLMGWLVSNTSSYWNAYGSAGVFAAALGAGLAMSLIVFLTTVVGLIRTKKAAVTPIGTQNEPALIEPAEPSLMAVDHIRAAVFDIGYSAEPFYRAVAVRNVRNASFYLEYRILFPGGDGWTTKVRKHLRTAPRIVTGEAISIPLAGVVESKEGQRWFVGCEAEMRDDFPSNVIARDAYYQGRVSMVLEDDTEEHCYFIMRTAHSSQPPITIGQHMWPHRQEWERGRNAVNIDDLLQES